MQINQERIVVKVTKREAAWAFVLGLISVLCFLILGSYKDLQLPEKEFFLISITALAFGMCSIMILLSPVARDNHRRYLEENARRKEERQQRETDLRTQFGPKRYTILHGNGSLWFDDIRKYDLRTNSNGVVVLTIIADADGYSHSPIYNPMNFIIVDKLRGKEPTSNSSISA